MRKFDTVWTLGADNALEIEPDNGNKTSARLGKHRVILGSNSPYYHEQSTIGGHTSVAPTSRRGYGGDGPRKY